MDSPSRMTGADAVVDVLVKHGVSTLFGLPGIQLDPLFNALHDARSQLRVINARHEQGVAYMALGFAQATGEPGIYACVPGPGFLNTTAALSTAYACHTQVLALLAQVATEEIGAGHGVLHELPDQTAIVRGLTRWNESLSQPKPRRAWCRAPSLPLPLAKDPQRWNCRRMSFARGSLLTRHARPKLLNLCKRTPPPSPRP